MGGMTLKIMREEGGIRALYRGIITTAVGVAPYVGINFAAYEFLRSVITPPGKTSVSRKLACGALAGEWFLGVPFPPGTHVSSLIIQPSCLNLQAPFPKP